MQKIRNSLLPFPLSFFGLRTSVFGLFFISFLLLTSCKDIRKEYYADGKVKSVLSFKGKVMNGISVWYYDGGDKMMECEYKNGNIDGKMSRWYYNGNLKTEQFYVNNRQNGKCTDYFERGGKQAEQYYKNDTVDGPFIEYYPDMQVKSKGKYSMGVWDGKWEYFDEKGILVGEGNFVKGTGVLKGYYWNGRLNRVDHYLNGQKDGKETSYKENGEIEKELVFKQGKLVEEEK